MVVPGGSVNSVSACASVVVPSMVSTMRRTFSDPASARGVLIVAFRAICARPSSTPKVGERLTILGRFIR